MDYLAAIKAFVRAVDMGSFSKAAAEQDLKVSTVSRYVSALEADLGTTLLNRSTRRLHLTEAGASFYDRAAAILADIDDARLTTASLDARPQGLLRLNIPGAFGRRHVVPHLKDFQALYPLVRLDVSLTDATVNLIETGTDLAIRIGALEDSTLVARRLAAQRRLLVAAPAYLQHHEAPENPADLSSHQCLSFTLQGGDAWYYRPHGGQETDMQEVKIHGNFRANESDALLQLAHDGLGLALLPTWILSDEIDAGRLVPVHAEWEWTIASGHERAIWGVYPPKKTVSPKVRAFLTFIAERFGNPPYWDGEHEQNPPHG